MMKFCRSSSRLKYSVRHATAGAEWRMVRTFVGSLVGLLPDRNFALFVGPRLPIGYPDCVLVEYDPADFSSWTVITFVAGVVDLLRRSMLRPFANQFDIMLKRMDTRLS